MSAANVTPDGYCDYTLIGDTDPIGDVCSTGGDQNSFKGRNIGDLLNAKGVSWGWFQGGFDLGITNANGSTGCGRWSPQTVPDALGSANDYIPHHEPFQYFASTANPTHARPSSVSAIGSTLEDDGATVDPANHQYDSHDFFAALKAGNLPAVSYVKAPALPGRSRRLLQSDRRTALHRGGRHGRAGEPGVGLDGHHPRLRRLRRLVRPPGAPHREPLDRYRRRAQRRGTLQPRRASSAGLPRAHPSWGQAAETRRSGAVAMERASRCSSSPPSPRRTPSTTPSPTRPRS